MKIAFIGRGRVATHMSKAFAGAGHDVIMCGGRERTCQIPNDTDVVIISVKDDAISGVASELRDCKALVLHTSGSISMDSICSGRRGVLYPLQTFSLDRDVDFRKVPLFLEASSHDDMMLLQILASDISDHCYPLDGSKRCTLHLAAVFCCNFVNHMMVLANDVVERSNIPFHTLFPLIEETIAKIHDMTPIEAQTGPAVRWDEKVMNSHMGMLENSTQKEIYRLLSESIRKTHIDNNKKTE